MKTIVPIDSLKPDTLRAVIEEFVTRDGAVHGHADVSVDQQIESMRQQLRAGKVAIVFDDETEDCTICRTEDLRDARMLGDDADASAGG